MVKNKVLIIPMNLISSDSADDYTTNYSTSSGDNFADKYYKGKLATKARVSSFEEA